MNAYDVGFIIGRLIGLGLLTLAIVWVVRRVLRSRKHV